MKLKPCPFCGNEITDIVDCSETTCAFAIDCFCTETCFNKMYAVVCSRTKGGCGAAGGYEHTREEAIEAWERRANELDQRHPLDATTGTAKGGNMKEKQKDCVRRSLVAGAFLFKLNGPRLEHAVKRYDDEQRKVIIEIPFEDIAKHMGYEEEV